MNTSRLRLTRWAQVIRSLQTDIQEELGHATQLADRIEDYEERDQTRTGSPRRRAD